MKRNEAGKQPYFAQVKAILMGPVAFIALALMPSQLPAQSYPQTPLSYFAIFYQNLLEFSTTATMTINGPVHCNTNIYVGAGGGATLTFNSTVSSAGLVLAPQNNGAVWSDPTNYNSAWNTVFNGNPGFVTHSPIINTTLGANPHALIEMPLTGEDPNGFLGSQRLYNQAQVILTVSNLAAIGSNFVVWVKVQKSPDPSQVPGADPAPILLAYTNPTPAVFSNALPFLSLTNRFYDRREGTTNITTQIDLGKYKQWLTNSSFVTSKYTSITPDDCPTILFVADNRNTNSHQQPVIRITNGVAPPPNKGLGFSIATPNPLYIIGHYNCTNSSYLGTTNTSATIPCAFYCDALTILAASWSDLASLTTVYSAGSGAWNAQDTTINAAIVAGIVPSTGSDMMHFSGGVHNYVRLLQNWNSRSLILNTALINLYSSTRATGQFLDPGSYYFPPTRKYSHDPKFFQFTNTPPGMPMAFTGSPLIFSHFQTLVEPLDADSLTASVGAAGNGPVSYQWSFNGTDIDGATNNSLTLTNLHWSQASGFYDVAVFDTVSTNSQTVIHLIVTNTPPIFTQQPASLAVLTGSNAMFSAGALGNSPMFWQWQFNGTNIDNATNTTLVLDNVTPDQAGTYSVFITNANGSTPGSNAALSVYTSAVATMTPPLLSTDNQIQFALSGVPGLNYVLQASTDLVNWDSIATNISPFNFTDTNSANIPQRYYRAIYLP